MIHRFVEKPHASSTSGRGCTIDFSGSIPYAFIESYISERIAVLARQDDLIYEYGTGKDVFDPALPKPYGFVIYFASIEAIRRYSQLKPLDANAVRDLF